MKKLFLIILVAVSAWTWIGFAKGSKNDAAQLVELESTEAGQAREFVRKAFADYDQTGEKALRKYWSQPVHEPAFTSSVELLDKLSNLGGAVGGRTVHPKFNRDSLLMEVKAGGRKIQVSLAAGNQGYAIESITEPGK